MYYIICALLWLFDLFMNLCTFWRWSKWQGNKSSGARYREARDAKGRRYLIIQQRKD